MSTERFSACDYTQSHESDASVLRYYEIEVLNRPPMHTLACARRVHQARRCVTGPAMVPALPGKDTNDPAAGGRYTREGGRQDGGREAMHVARCMLSATGGTPPRKRDMGRCTLRVATYVARRVFGMHIACSNRYRNRLAVELKRCVPRCMVRVACRMPQ
jgi:hypothetical protein